jgi:hypothetical protein
MVFLEASRDIGEIERWRPAQRKFQRSKTVAHEFGHQWKLEDESGGIMTGGDSNGTAGDVERPSPLLLRQLRIIRTKPGGPGPNP